MVHSVIVGGYLIFIALFDRLPRLEELPRPTIARMLDHS